MKAWLGWLAARLARLCEPGEPGLSGTHAEVSDRVFHLRTRIHCGYY